MFDCRRCGQMLQNPSRQLLQVINFVDWSGVQVGSELHNMALETLQFGQRALELNAFARGDYKKVCELFVVGLYLGSKVNNFLFHQPGACHEARFLADALYLFILQMTKKLTNIMNKEEEEMVQTSSSLFLFAMLHCF